MQTVKRATVVIIAVFITLLFAGTVFAADQVFKLKMADSFPIGHPGNKLALGYIEMVEKESGGRIKIEYYPAQQLGKMKDLLKLCQGGITDIAYIAPSFYAGQLPLNTVMTLPFWTTAMEGTEIYQTLVKESPELEEEFKKYNIRPLSVFATSQYDVGTVKQKVTKPEDLKGLRLKTSGGIFDKIAQQFGIIPVTVASPEVYEATQRGIVDGNIFSLASVKGYRVNELEKYHTLGLRLGGFPSMYAINGKTWKKLPPDLQKVLTGSAEKIAAVFAFVWDKKNTEAAEEFETAGMEIFRVPDEERAMWDAPLEGIEKVWIEDMNKMKRPGQKVFDRFKAIAQKVTEGDL
jgi:TRAP-type C4-dicarboxylate transport system substrate-binding protein